MPDLLDRLRLIGSDKRERERVARRALTLVLGTSTPPARPNLQHVFWTEDDLDRGSLLAESNGRAYAVKISVRELGPTVWTQ